MNLYRETLQLIKIYGIRPRKKLGQNFCVDEEILIKMIEHAKLSEEDIVLEVGAGLGSLTNLLCGRAKKVYAIEVDSRLFKILQNRFNDVKNVDIINSDVLKTQLPQFNKIVCNPPYSISSPLIFKILESNFESGVMTLQKDFAERIVANEGGKDYGRLTVMTTLKADVKILDYVPKNAFYPVPDVESAIIEMTPIKQKITILNEEDFAEFIRALFNQRNKKLRNGVISFLKRRHSVYKEETDAIIENLPYLEERVYKLKPENLLALFNDIYQKLMTKRVTKRL